MVMKASANHTARGRSDFYLTTLAPLCQRKQARISVPDVLLLTVSFLELAVFVRLLLAN